MEKDFSPFNDVLQDRFFRRLSKRVGRAIGDFGLITENDIRILLAVSGGKDSLALVDFMLEKQKRSPVKFELFAFHVAMDESVAEGVAGFLEDRHIEFEIDLDSFKGVDLSNPKDRCFLCSWNRRKAIFLSAKRHNCRYVALGHNMDDAAETVLMNMFFQASVSAMSPRQEMFGGEIIIIRPMIYLREFELDALADKFSYPIVKKCAYEQDNVRSLVRGFIKRLEEGNKKISVAKNIFLSLNNINSQYLPKYVNKSKEE